MSRSALILAVLMLGLFASRLPAQTKEIQDDIDLRLRMEKFMKDAQKRQDELAKDLEKLQQAVNDLKDQLKNQTKIDDVEVWKKKLAEAEQRALLAEMKLAAADERARQGLEEARRQALKAETILQDLQVKIRALEEALTGKPPEKKLVELPMFDTPKGAFKGKVTKVDEDDKGLIFIDLGSEQGLKNGQTLEVQRLNPEPLYLGSVRLIQVRAANSVGRMLVLNPLKAVEVKVGDTVTNRMMK